MNSKKSHAANYRIDGYEVEGKTGTAQVAAPNGGGYVKGPNPYFVSLWVTHRRKILKLLYTLV